MESEAFKNYIEICHKNWLGDLLSIPIRSRDGIDLLGDKMGIELKSRLRKYNHSFAVHAYQYELFRRANPDIELSWGLLLYELNKSPSELEDHEDLETQVTSREIWFVPWDWVKQFPVYYPKTGPYRYAKLHSLPPEKEFQDFQPGKADLHVHQQLPALLEKIVNLAP